MLCSAHSRRPLTAISRRSGTPALPPRSPAVVGAMDSPPLRADDPFPQGRLAHVGPECTHPLTGVAGLSQVYTDDSVFVLTDQGVVVREACGISRDAFAERLSVSFQDS